MTESPAWRPARWQRLAAGAVALTLILALFHQGAQPYAVGLIPSPWDKLAHLALYGLFAALLWLMAGGRHPVWVVLAVSAIGLADEWAQLYLPGREAGWADLSADVAGAVLMMGLLSWWARGGAREADAVGKKT